MTAKVSVVIPTLNEVGNIVELVDEVKRAIASTYEVEVLVVDDGSSDGTREELASLSLLDPQVRLVARDVSPGLALSILEGIQTATGDRILVMDADFTHDPGEIGRMLRVSQDYDLVSGSRFCQGGSMPSKRHYVASLSFNWVLRVVLRTQVQDNLGGFWTMRASDVRALPLEDIFTGYGEYFFRLLHCAHHSGFSIIELPSKYGSRQSGESKSRFGRLVFSYSWAAFRFRRRVRMGRISLQSRKE
jgi:dolichol-phosphate mannosyltransferase